jgi:hypothetical protein
MCTFQKIYGVGKAKLQIKLSGTLKNINLVENLTEINLCFYTLYLFVCFKLQMKLVVLNL